MVLKGQFLQMSIVELQNFHKARAALNNFYHGKAGAVNGGRWGGRWKFV